MIMKVYVYLDVTPYGCINNYEHLWDICFVCLPCGRDI